MTRYELTEFEWKKLIAPAFSCLALAASPRWTVPPLNEQKYADRARREEQDDRSPILA